MCNRKYCILSALKSSHCSLHCLKSCDCLLLKLNNPLKCFSYPCALEMSGRGYGRKNIKTKASSKKDIKQTLKMESDGKFSIVDLSHSESSKIPIKKRKLENIDISEETNDGFGFELHDLGQYGICEKCGAKWPENQVCPGEYHFIKRTSAGWVSKICEKKKVKISYLETLDLFILI